MRSEVRREAISFLLGDLREFQECTGQLHLSGLQTLEIRLSLFLKVIKNKLKKTAAKNFVELFLQPIPRRLKKFVGLLLQLIPKSTQKTEAGNLVKLFLDFVPQELFNNYLGSGGRVEPDKWNEWLQICWGYNDDTLSMLSAINNYIYMQDFEKFVEKLPIIQSPPLDKSQQQYIFDYHTHIGALYPPSLQWAQCINTGINYNQLVPNKNYSECNLNGYNNNSEEVKDKIVEHRKNSQLCHRYLSVARVLMGAMLDIYELLTNSGQPNSSIDKFDAAKCSELIEKVSNILYKDEDNAGTRKELASLLKNYLSLNNSSLKYLPISIKPGYFSKKSSEELDEVHFFLNKERKCIAYLLWKSYKNELGFFIQEILFTYLRLKGAWFQINSGINLRFLTPHEHLLLKINDLSDVQNKIYRDNFHSPMSKALKQVYGNIKSRKTWQVRLPFMKDDKDLERNISLLRNINDEIDLVVSFPRYNISDNKGKWDNRKQEYLKFLGTINKLIDDTSNKHDNLDKTGNKLKFRVCGVDFVGTNHSINWDDYAQFINDMREKINLSNFFVTYHLDEEKKVFFLKELCEILILINKGALRKNDRISHGWSLLLKINKYNQINKKNQMHKQEWNLIKAGLKQIEDKLTVKERQELDKLKSIPIIENKNYNVEINFNALFGMETRLQKLVKNELIKQEIRLEICPTSSWRIAGIPTTKHPVKSWIEAGGEVLVGTDYPAVFPCTIASEYYSLQRLMEQSNMPSNSQPKYKYDVFISHASEDKKEFVDGLAEKLKGLGYDVWYDKDVLIIGDSLSSSIDKGVSDSQYGIIVLSPHSIIRNKEWIQRELKELIEKEKQEQKVLLPIWHKVSPEEIQKFSDDFAATLTDESKVNIADKFAVQSSEDVSTVVSQIVKALGTPKNPTQEYFQPICVQKLSQMDDGELQELMIKHLSLLDVENIWVSILGTNIDENVPNKTKDRAIMNLFTEAKNNGKREKLIEKFCEKRAKIIK